MAITLPDIVQRVVARVDTSGVDQFGRQLSGFEQTASRVGKSLTTSLTLPVTAFGAVTLKTAADFEFAMNRVRALTGATGGDFEALESKARELGATTQFTATQAAEGMQFLALAGFEANEILTAIPATLNLAAAGAIELGQAADIASNILTAFNRPTSDLGEIVDALTQTFTSSNTSLVQLGEAFKFVGPIAQAAGLDFNEVSASIGLLGNAGIQATLAGTALRGSITRLLKPTAAAQEALDRLGISVTDSNGNLLSLTEIVGKFESVGLSAADAMTIFGLRAGPGFAALVSQGSKALAELTTELDNSAGRAEEVAEIQLEGLKGAFLELKSAFQEFQLALADSGIAAFFERLADGLRDIFRALAEVNPTILKTSGILLGLGAAVGPLLLGLGKFRGLMRTTAAAFKTNTAAITTNTRAHSGNWKAINHNIKAQTRINKSTGVATLGLRKMSVASKLSSVSMVGVAGALGGIGTAIGIALPLIVSFINRKSDQEKAIERVEEALLSENGVLTQSTDEWARYINETSQFKLDNQIDDLQRMSTTVADLQQLLAAGGDGILEFIKRATAAGEVSAEFGAIFSEISQTGTISVETIDRVALSNTELAEEMRRVASDGDITVEALRRLITFGVDLGSKNLAVVDTFVAEQLALEAVSESTIHTAGVLGTLTQAQINLINSQQGVNREYETWAQAGAAADVAIESNRVLADSLGISIESLVSMLNQQARESAITSGGMDGLAESFSQAGTSALVLTNGVDLATERQKAVEDQIRQTAKALNFEEEKIEALIQAFRDGDGVQGVFNEGLDETGEAADGAASAIEELTEATNEYIDDTLSFQSAQDKLNKEVRDAQVEYAELKNAGEDLSAVYQENSDRGDDLRKTVRDMIGAVQDYSDAQETDAEKARILRTGIDQLKTVFPELAEEIDELTEGGFVDFDNAELSPEVAVDGIPEADGAIDGFVSSAETTIDEGEYVAEVEVDVSSAEATLKTAKEDFEDEGENLAHGIADGFGLGTPFVVNAAIAVVRAAERAIASTWDIFSPSRRFAKEIGEPIAQGIALGIHEEGDSITDELLDIIEEAADKVSAQIDSVFGAIGAGFSFGDAQKSLEDIQEEIDDLQSGGKERTARERALEDAKREKREAVEDQQAVDQELTDLLDRQIELDDLIAKAEGRVANARRESTRVTLEERVAIERSNESVERAEERFKKGEISINQLNLARQRHREVVRESTAETRSVSDAQDDLNRLEEEAITIVGDISEQRRRLDDANRTIEESTRSVEEADEDLLSVGGELLALEKEKEEAQLKLVDAQRNLEQAGQDLIDQGPAGEQYFKDLAREAGLTEDAIDNLITKYGNLARDAANARTEAAKPIIIPRPIVEPETDSNGGSGSNPTSPGFVTVGGTRFSDRLAVENPFFLADSALLGLASGGFVQSPIVAAVGEGPSREVVLPIDDQKTIDVLSRALERADRGIVGAQGGDINIEINNPRAETSSQSLSRELRILSDEGMFQ